MDAHIRSDGDDDEPDESGTMAEQSETIGDRREGRPTLHWREDPGKLARRIFEWWKIRIHGVSNTDFIFFAIAIRLAILLQVSSCDVERGFSQWVAILNACGKQMKKPVIESRMFLRVNNDLLDYFLSKVDKNVMEGSLAQVAIDNEMASDVRDDDDEEATMNDV